MRLADVDVAQALTIDRDVAFALIATVERGELQVTIGKYPHPDMIDVVSTPIIAALRSRIERIEQRLTELGVECE
jgi:hypothetical protein